MKELEVTCEWRTTHTIEVEDDFVIPMDGRPDLGHLPEAAVNEANFAFAELLDLKVAPSPE